MDRLTADQRTTLEANLGLAGWAVQRWARHLPVDGNGYTQADAYQDAVIGLARAVQAYDPSTGHRLATYAALKMRSAIQRGMGTHEGINHRRQATSGSMVAEQVPSLNQLVDGPSGHPTELGDLLADNHDHQGDMDAAATCALLERHRRVLCGDSIDEALLDAILDPETDWRTSAPAIDAVSARYGMSKNHVRRRLNRLRDRIGVRLALADAA